MAIWINPYYSIMMKTFKYFLFTCVVCLMCGGCSSEQETISSMSDVPRLNASDSLTLISIYQKIGPWGRPWDFEDITTWNGVQTALDVSTNQIRVVGFEVYNGSFNGYFPEEFCKLTELRRLVVAGGTIRGRIPEDIGKLKNLVYFCIADNKVSGHIPESIGELTELQQLDFRNTDMTDTIPESIGRLVKMRYLYLFGNKFTGNIPHGIANMNQLKMVALQDNQFSGCFPLDILKKDILMMCEDNNITELPFEIWSDDNEYVPPILKRNRLSGEIPEWVKKTKKWNRYASVCISIQQDGFGYTNYSTTDMPI